MQHTKSLLVYKSTKYNETRFIDGTLPRAQHSPSLPITPNRCLSPTPSHTTTPNTTFWFKCCFPEAPRPLETGVPVVRGGGPFVRIEKENGAHWPSALSNQFIYFSPKCHFRGSKPLVPNTSLLIQRGLRVSSP